MGDNTDKEISEEELNNDIKNLNMQEIEFDSQSNKLEIEDDDFMMKFAKSRGKKKE